MLLNSRTMEVAWLLFVILALTPMETLSGEYGEMCYTDMDCKSTDTRNPLVCVDPFEPPTTTEATEDPPTSSDPTTEDPSTSPDTTTEDPSTSPDTTTEDPSTSPDTTTEDPPTSSEPTTGTTEKSIPSPEPLTNDTEKSSSPSDTSTEVAGEKSAIESLNEMEFSLYRATTTEKPFSPYLVMSHISLKDSLTTESRVCSCPRNMIRDEGLKRCVSPPSGDCDTRYGDGSYMKTCTKFATCYPKYENSSDSTGTCVCDLDAIVDPSTNECKLNYGSKKCEMDSDCDTRNLLTCRDQTCVCMYDHLQKWNPAEGKCGFIVGESCAIIPPFPGGICVENAVCLDDTKICTCDNGYRPTPEGICKLPYGSQCNEDDECHPFFHCKESTCTCAEGESYFNSTERCHIPEGAPCNPSTDACTPRSECKNEVCHCESGYQASTEHTCHALYNSKCSDEVPCHIDWYLDECPVSSPFCQCKQNYHYNSASERCVGNLDEMCNVDEDCIDHAICQGEQCNCGGNYIPGENKTACYTYYGRPCSNIACYPGHFLKCSENDLTCECANTRDQMLDESKGYCVALAGRFCSDLGQGIECAENSVCGAEEKCVCVPGYTANSTGHCIFSEDDNSSAMTLKFKSIYEYSFIVVLWSIVHFSSTT